MKKFWWAQYYKLAGTKRKNANTKAEFCRRMALMPVGKKIKIPRRQFIGESAVLMKQFDEWLKNTVEMTLKNNLKP